MLMLILVNLIRILLMDFVRFGNHHETVSFVSGETNNIWNDGVNSISLHFFIMKLYSTNVYNELNKYYFVILSE